MYEAKSNTKNLNTFLSYYFLSFPFLIFLGNAFLNVYFSLLLLLTTYSFFSAKIKIKLFFYENILLFFLVYILLVNIIFKNTFGSYRILNLSSHIAIFILLSRLVNFNTISLKSYLNLFSALIIFLIFDTIFQYLFGYNVLGFPKLGSRLTSLFKDEAIIGTYLTYFAIIAFMYLSYLISKKFKNINAYTYFILFFLIGFFTIVITGERMATLLFILYFIMVSIFLKVKIKKFLIPLGFSLCIIYFIIPKDVLENRILRGISDVFYIDSIKKYSSIDIHFRTLKQGFENSHCYLKDFGEIRYEDRLSVKNQVQNNSLNIDRYLNQFNDHDNLYTKKKLFLDCRKKFNNYINTVRDKYLQDQQKGFFSSPIGLIFSSSYNIIKENFLFGIGIKKYRLVCDSYQSKTYPTSCSTHPHNLYIEILVETGFFGLIIFITFLVVFILNLAKVNYSNNNNLFRILFITQISCFLILFWPVKTSGSFFSSFNSSFFWFNLILLNSFILNNKTK